MIVSIIDMLKIYCLPGKMREIVWPHNCKHNINMLTVEHTECHPSNEQLSIKDTWKKCFFPQLIICV